VQILDHDAKRVHYVQEMFHAEQGWLAATMEVICMHVDMTAKRSAPFPPEMLAQIAEMHAAHQGLPVPPQVGHRIGIVRQGLTSFSRAKRGRRCPKGGCASAGARSAACPKGG
jgi:acyl-CoA thioester hydrolase